MKYVCSQLSFVMLARHHVFTCRKNDVSLNEHWVVRLPYQAVVAGKEYAG